MTRMPPGEAERGGEQRRFRKRKSTDGVEGGPGVGMRLLGAGKPRLALFQTQEKVGSGYLLPFEAAVFPHGGKPVAPDQLPRVDGLGKLGHALGSGAKDIRAVDS